MASLFSALGSMFGVFELPGWFSGFSAGMTSLGELAAPFGAWIPFGSIVNALGLVAAALAIALVIKVVRIVASFLTAGGGSAA